jgi:hypothetical protein
VPPPPPPPPQPMPAEAMSSRKAKHTANQILPVVLFFLLRRNGSNASGQKTNDEAAPATVSAKTTVTWKFPVGVDEAVAIVTVLAVAE